MKFTKVVILVVLAASICYSALARAENISLICEATGGNGTIFVQVDTATGRVNIGATSFDATITENSVAWDAYCGFTTINRKTGEMVVRRKGWRTDSASGVMMGCGYGTEQYVCHRNRNQGF